MTSAFSLRSRTVARRTVQTLIGSYVALRTSTRPPDQRPEPSESDPCRRGPSSGTDPSGAGGTPIAGRSVAKGTAGFPRFGRRPALLAVGLPSTDGVGRLQGSSGRRRERTEDANGLAVAAQRLDRPGHAGVGRVAGETEEEHVGPGAAPPRPRLDPREVDRPLGELAQAGHKPTRRQV